MDLTKRYEEVARALESPDVELRKRALSVLLKTPPNLQTLDLFRRVAASDESEDLRLIGQQAYQKSREALADHLLHVVNIYEEATLNVEKMAFFLGNEKVELRLEALRQFRERPASEALDLLGSSLRNEQDYWVQAALIKAIGQVGNASQIAVIQPFLTRPYSLVVISAMEVLDAIGGDFAIPILGPFVGHRKREINMAATRIICSHDPETVVTEVRRLAKETDEADREAALIAALQLQPPALEPLLLELFESESSPGLMRRQATALARCGGQLALESMARLLGDRSTQRAAFAKQVQASIAKRLGVSIEAVVAMEIAVEKEKKRRTEKIQLSRLQAKALTPEPTGLEVMKSQAPALVTAGSLILLGLILGILTGQSESLGLPEFPDPISQTIERAACDPKGRIDTKAGISFIGVIQRRLPHGLVVTHGPYLLRIQKADRIDPGLVRGRRVAIEGSITARNRMGGLTVEARSLRVSGADAAGEAS